MIKNINKSQVQGAIQTINGSSVKPVNAKLLAAIQRAHKSGNNTSASITKQSTSQQSAISSSMMDQSVTVANVTGTPGSTSQQHKKNSKSQNPNQVLKHIKYNTG